MAAFKPKDHPHFQKFLHHLLPFRLHWYQGRLSKQSFADKGRK